ncbi:hypothetical protein HHK36_010651 [Tetracentron sinense]|uniref:Reverse transcriptase n=1 Tax=Tetracentron sinense TaxID=13715 RepID=A0A834ZBD5_TETSI|nr:hypothetical protein HHK36_010651 [Tetracentron sinense]
MLRLTPRLLQRTSSTYSSLRTQSLDSLLRDRGSEDEVQQQVRFLRHFSGSASSPSLSIWRRKKEMGKEGLIVAKELKRLKSDAIRLDRFMRTHVSRLLKSDLLAVLAEFQRQDLVFLCMKTFKGIWHKKYHKSINDDKKLLQLFTSFWGCREVGKEAMEQIFVGRTLSVNVLAKSLASKLRAELTLDMDQADLLQKLIERIDRMEASFHELKEESIARAHSTPTSPHGSAPRRGNIGRMDDHVHSGGVNQMRHLRLEFPRFDDTDPVPWLNQAERFFKFHQIPPDQQVEVASFHLEKEALQWYHWLERQYDFISWGTFSEALISRFGPTEFEDYSANLKRLKQIGSLRDYQSEFERTSSRLPDLPTSHLVSFFIEGLKDDIRWDVKSQKPLTMFQAISLARLYEEKQVQVRKNSRFGLAKSGTSYNPPALSATPKTTTSNFKRLTVAEMKERREKGLCYNCDEKFTTNHRCKAQQFCIVGEGAPFMELEQSNSEDDEDNNIDEQSPELVDSPAISFHALMGSIAPQTMRVQGTIKREPVTMLIDSGSTHNFLNEKIAKRLGCRVQIGGELRVTVASGETLSSNGMWPQLPFTVQQEKFVADMYLLDFGGCDVVLGAQWLRTLGPILWDFANLWMKFTANEKDITIQGMTEPQTKFIKSTQAQHEIRNGASCAVLYMCSAGVESKEPTNPELLQSLEQYADIFEEPKGLPPARDQDHQINLLPRSRPVSEMFAIIYAITKWRPYLIGRRFTIRTDHRSLKYMMDQRVSTPTQQKWLSKLLGYDYEVIYKKGSENCVADALSRYTTDASLAAISTPEARWLQDLILEMANSPHVVGITQKIQAGSSDYPNYTIEHGQLRYKGRLVLDSNTDVTKVSMQQMHDSPEAGHIYDVVRKEIWYRPDMFFYRDMLMMLARNKKVDEAKWVWGDLKREEVLFDLHTHGDIIRSFLDSGLPSEAMELYEEMKRSPDPPISLPYRVILKGLLPYPELREKVKDDFLELFPNMIVYDPPEDLFEGEKWERGSDDD